MRNSYNYQEQVRFLQDIASTNIALAQFANKQLKTIPAAIISKAVQELKEEYQQQIGDEEEDNNLSAIKNTLNLAARERVTNIDELFLNLSQEINSYYQKDVIKVSKKTPFTKICSHCHEGISNDTQGHRWHQEKCKNGRRNGLAIAPQKKSKKKTLDTIEKYEQRQKKLAMAELAVKTENQPIAEKMSQRQSKRNRLKSKIESKYSRKLIYLFQKDSEMNDKEEVLNFLAGDLENSPLSCKQVVLGAESDLDKGKNQKRQIFVDEEDNEEGEFYNN